MTVRLTLALTIFATGLVTALAASSPPWSMSFQRFEHETAYRRGMAFLVRVVSMYDNIFDMHEQSPEEFQRWLRDLVLYEPDIELYLLDADGLIARQDRPARKLKPGFRVAARPGARSRSSACDTSYVMGDDPEHMDADAVIVAKPVHRGDRPDRRAERRLPLPRAAQPQQLPADRLDVLRSQLRPAGDGRGDRRRRLHDPARAA